MILFRFMTLAVILFNLTVSAQVKTARNPIIFADVPDVSMIRIGDTYYMSSTTMHMSPGVPIMKSKDLVNWQVVSYAYDTLGNNDALNLNNDKNAYGRGSWASCIRYHNGTYYVSTFSSTTGKTYIWSTKDIEKGPWKEISFSPSFHDHTLFFDDDGRVYLIYGNKKLSLVELNADASGVKTGGINQVIIENSSAPSGSDSGLGEGSQLFKVNGKYYLFNITWPKGGMRTVVIHRADKITGPWEGRLAFQDKGVAQGGMVDTPDGRWFVYLFRDYGSVGRIPYIVPMKWEDGWPVIGIDGKVPDALNLPPSKGLIPGIVASDEFKRRKGEAALPLVWQWNHNPDNKLWSVTQRKGYLRLTTGRIDTIFVSAKNTLTQRTFGPECSGSTSIDVSNMKEGDFAGLALLQRKFGLVGVKFSDGTKSIVMVSAESGKPVEVQSVPLKQKTAYLKAECDFRDRANIADFYYSLDGKTWKPIGSQLKMEYTMPHFMGYRFGLFNYATRTPGGFVDFDYFHINDKIIKNACVPGIVATAQTVNDPRKYSSRTPLMGWASWNQFGVNIDENLIKKQADAMVSSGLAAAGFRYINIDDGFFNKRYANGNLRIDSVKFPKGMKHLVDYIHTKGLKAGFYSEAGENTCGSQYSGQPGGVGGGMYNHDQQDADLFFKTWGFDFLKVDYCGGLKQQLDEKTRYNEIRRAIDNTGRTDINFNVCRWQFPGTWVTTVANSWRMSHDINYVPGSKPKWKSILSIINLNKYLAPYASPGHYNDMDMLEVGRGMTAVEDKSHFSMWCILSSPLALGNDMTKMTEETKAILTNSEVIAVNQDTTGLQAHLISEKDSMQVWAKNLNGRQSKEFVVALLNQGITPATISVEWKDLNIVGKARVRDLWAHADLGTMDSMFSATVSGHGVSMIKVTAKKTKLKEVFEAEYSWVNNFNLTSYSVSVPDQAKHVADTSCSGGAKVTGIGNRADNYIEFRDIYARGAGNYTLILFYISGENRTATFTINGNETVLTNLNSGGWGKIAKTSLPAELQKGYNVVRISNTTGGVPEIDKIEIDLNKEYRQHPGHQ